jgi:primosomal protein N' (replication factor Y)
MIVSAILMDTTRQIDRFFDYNVPSHMEHEMVIGARILVPFGKGNRLREAVVFALKSGTVEEYKYVHQIFGKEFHLSEEMVPIAQKLHDYYLASYSRLVKSMLPSGSKNAIETTIHFKTPEIENEYLQDKGQLNRMISEGLAELKATVKRKQSIRYIHQKAF